MDKIKTLIDELSSHKDSTKVINEDNNLYESPFEALKECIVNDSDLLELLFKNGASLNVKAIENGFTVEVEVHNNTSMQNPHKLLCEILEDNHYYYDVKRLIELLQDDAKDIDDSTVKMVEYFLNSFK